MLENRDGWIGVDEAGRGPLAGPVVAAAVWMPPDFEPDGITDSKRMTPRAREEAAVRIKEGCRWGIGVVEVEEIDRLNILQATLLAMRLAVGEVRKPYDGVLVDGNRPPPGLGAPVECVIRGDGRFAQIAAASILAKTHRDSIMRTLAKEFPDYGFEHNFGYATRGHISAIFTFGPSAIHRKTFNPVRAILTQPCLSFTR
ncbi:MAG: ribonuclease HII [Armatimonadetes bacterium]|nr:ribonuclease HII [Armatimonadota bacterium]